ncbi:MAG: N-acetyltransferase family protein [Saprospiraceae bacterium]
MEIIFSSVATSDEVTQILDLQAQNHVLNVSPAVAQEQGFVTVKHDPLVLQRMNEVAPSIIAKDGGRVVGYALVMPRSFSADIPILQPMFDLLDTLSWQGTPLCENSRWFAMGQICVAEGYRGMGVFDGMYQKMKEVCQSEFDFVITEIAERNVRSIRAHERVGFETLHTFSDAVAGEVWRVVVWDWEKGRPEVV